MSSDVTRNLSACFFLFIFLFGCGGGGNTSSGGGSTPPPPSFTGDFSFVRIDSTPTSNGFIGEPGHRLVIFHPATQRLFVANRSLNRIDVFSAIDKTLVVSLPVPRPSSVDISPNGLRLWVGTSVEQVYVIDPQSLEIVERIPFRGFVPRPDIRFTLPQELVWTSNGTTLVNLRTRNSTGTILGQWDPIGDTVIDRSGDGLRFVGPMARSGDYSKVIIGGNTTGGNFVLYDASTDSFPARISYFGSIPGVVAANHDGTQFAVYISILGGDDFVVFLDEQLSEIGRRVVGNVWGMVYSRDGRFLYISENFDPPPVITVIDTASLQEVGKVPDFRVAEFRTRIFDVDDSGLLFGINNRGVVFLPATNPSSTLAVIPLFGRPPVVNPVVGNSSASTEVALSGSNFQGGSNVFFGSRGGTNVSLTNLSEIRATAPASSPGPVNVSVVSGEGMFAVAPDGFTYGPHILRIIPTAGSIEGGDPVMILGYGLMSGSSQPTVALGGRTATVLEVFDTQQTKSQFALDFTYPFPIQSIRFQTPPGVSGRVDLTVTNDAGTATAPESYQYLKTVKSFPKPGPLRAVHYDEARQRIYLTGPGQVEVFDLNTQQYLSPLIPPGGPFPDSNLLGMDITPDGSKLIVADIGLQSVHIFDLISPGDDNTVFVGGAFSQSTSGPARVAATSTNKVFVTIARAGSGCDAIECLREINLSTLVVSSPDQTGLPFGLGATLLVEASQDGEVVFFANGNSTAGDVVVWDAASDSFQSSRLENSFRDIAVASDGNVFVAGIDVVTTDLRLALIPVFTNFYFIFRGGGLTFVPGVTLHPTGSLLYQPIQLNFSGSGGVFPGGVDIFDIHTGVWRERVFLSEPPRIAQSAMVGDFLAVDETGKRLFVITESGFTLVELSQVPLSIGSITPKEGPVSGGTPVTVRGSGFEVGTTIQFGTTSVQTTFIDENTLQVTSPAAAAGSKPITVISPGGRSYTFHAAFEYH